MTRFGKLLRSTAERRGTTPAGARLANDAKPDRFGVRRREMFRAPRIFRRRRADHMRTSVVTSTARAHQRLVRTAQQAMVHARDGGEQELVDFLFEAARAGHIPLRDAHAALSALRRDQQQTAA